MFVLEYGFIKFKTLKEYEEWLSTLRDAPTDFEIVAVSNNMWSIGVTFRYSVEA